MAETKEINVSELIAKLEGIAQTLIAEHSGKSGGNVYVYVNKNIKPLIATLGKPKDPGFTTAVALATAFKVDFARKELSADDLAPQPTKTSVSSVKKELQKPKIGV